MEQKKEGVTAGFVNMMDEAAAKLQKLDGLSLKEKSLVLEEIAKWVMENSEPLANFLSLYIGIYTSLVQVIKDVGILIIKIMPGINTNLKTIRLEAAKLNTVRLDKIKEKILLGRVRDSLRGEEEE
jgi:hypothetical protein